MATLVTDRTIEERLKSERQIGGGDRFDEVWEGLAMMTPMPNAEHQDLATRMSAVLRLVLGWDDTGDVYAGINLSDREVGWEHNYRVPDVAVFLPNTRAKNCGTHWCGGPDWVMEIVSPDDRTREKIPFYSQLGVGELLIVDRDPWGLQLYQPRGGKLVEVGHAALGQREPLTSAILPLSFGLKAGPKRPRIEALKTDSDERWLA